MTDSYTIVEVLPMLRRHIGGADAEGLNGVDCSVHALDLPPAIDPQQGGASEA